MGRVLVLPRCAADCSSIEHPQGLLFYSCADAVTIFAIELRQGGNQQLRKVDAEDVHFEGADSRASSMQSGDYVPGLENSQRCAHLSLSCCAEQGDAMAARVTSIPSFFPMCVHTDVGDSRESDREELSGLIA